MPKKPTHPTVKLAPNAMTTLETMLEMLGIDPDAAGVAVQNNVIRLINAASSWVETIVGRKLGRMVHIQQCAASGSQELVLQQWPIQSVEYIKDTASGHAIPSGDYDITTSGRIGVIYKDNGWAFRGYTGGLSNDYVAAQRYLEVKYIAGYILPKDGTDDEPAGLPADLEGVVWGIVQQEFSIIRNGAQGLKAFSLSDVSWTFDKEPRQSWTETINRYVRW